MIAHIRVSNLIKSIKNIQDSLDATGKIRPSGASRAKLIRMLQDLQAQLRERIYRLEIRLEPEEWEAEVGATVRVRQAPALVGHIGTILAGIPVPNDLVPVEFTDHPSQWYAPKDIQLVVDRKIFQQYY